MRRILRASAFVLAVTACVLGATATASAAPGNGTNQIDQTDTLYSGVCGIPVVVHAVGVDRTTTSKDGSTIRNTFNVSVTETNPATGGSFTYKNTGNYVSTFTVQPDGSYLVKESFSGVNFRIETAQGKLISSGRDTSTLLFGFDEQGELYFNQAVHDTPHLSHFSDFLEQQGCALLAGS